MPRQSGRSAPTASADSSIQYRPCEAEPGMFNGELLVFVDGPDPNQNARPIKVQLLVDQHEVVGLHATPKRKVPAKGWLKVMLAGPGTPPKTGITTVFLPQAAQPVGENLLVNADVLRSSVG